MQKDTTSLYLCLEQYKLNLLDSLKYWTSIGYI